VSQNSYSNPIAALRQQVKDMQWQAEKKRREAKDASLVADAIYSQSIELDLLTDKIEKAMNP